MLKKIPYAQLSGNLLIIDEKLILCDSLKQLNSFLHQIQKDKMFWRWAIIALHSALYQAMILTLQGSNYERVLELCRGCKKTRSGKLISFEDAFKWISQEKKMRRFVVSERFVPSKKHKKAMRLINKELRNRFVHFVPQIWIINTKEFQEVFKSCLEIIRFCLFESGNISWSENEKKPYNDLLIKISACLNQYYMSD